MERNKCVIVLDLPDTNLFDFENVLHMCIYMDELRLTLLSL